MRSVYLRFVPFLLLLLSNLVPRLVAQVNVIPYDANWRYEQSGTLAPANWAQRGFDDSSWAQGQATFVAPATEALPPGQAARTTLNSPVMLNYNAYYFRIHFNNTMDPSRSSLLFSNVLDDGAIFYLNGEEIRRQFMPSGAFDNTTRATRALEAVNTGIEVFTVQGSDLLIGDNVLAVEVHQGGTTSSDMVFGLAVNIIPSFGPIFTTHPQGTNVVQGRNATLTSIATGVPTPTYQWFFSGNPIAGATTPDYTITNMTPAHAGQYFVRATGFSGAVDSQIAVVTYRPDDQGPVPLRAVWTNATTIVLTFDEAVMDPSSDAFSYDVTGGPNDLTVGTATIVGSSSNTVVLTTESARDTNSNYRLHVDLGADLFGNEIEVPVVLVVHNAPLIPKTVSNNNNSGAGSLRQAILNSDPGDIVAFAPNVTGTIALTSGELFINNQLSIVGPGAGQLAISGNTNSRVFHIGPQGNVDIHGLTLTEGRVVGANGAPGYRDINGNGFPGFTGGNALGGGILNEGSLRLYDCMITSNRVTGGTGGGGVSGFVGFEDEPASQGGPGGLGIGGGIYNGAFLEAFRCTFSGNTSLGGSGGRGGNNPPAIGAGASGGLGGGGASGALATGWATLENCTLAGNRAIGGGGGDGGTSSGPAGAGGPASAGALGGSFSLRSCTVSDNSASGGPGGAGGTVGASGQAMGGGITGGVLDLMNTLVAGNTGSPSSPDVFGTVTSQGWNLIGIIDGSSGWTANDLLGNSAIPLIAFLGPCQDNGGPVWTMCPLTGSPARDKGKSHLLTDARDGERVVDFPETSNAPGGNGSDIGALEVDSLFGILAITRPNTVSRVKFKSDPGNTYTLQRKNTLTNVPWTDVASAVVGNGQPLELTDPGPLPSARFYRIRAGTPTQLVYANNFEGTVGTEWNVPQAISTTPVGGRKFLGEFANTVATLQLANLPSHTHLSISFDLFILKSWDGNRTDFGPDTFQLSVRGGPTLIRSTFSTYTSQSHPGALTDSFPANTGAVEINTLGYTHPNLGPADAVYRLTATLNHTASGVTLDFSGVNLQDIGDESWGLDNVRVEAITQP